MIVVMTRDADLWGDMNVALAGSDTAGRCRGQGSSNIRLELCKQLPPQTSTSTIMSAPPESAKCAACYKPLIFKKWSIGSKPVMDDYYGRWLHSSGSASLQRARYEEGAMPTSPSPFFRTPIDS
jgi:hypothetical protein